MAVPNFLQKVSETEWVIPKTYKPGMHVPAKIIGTEGIVAQMDMQVYDQITNVATLPGIINYAYCMSDGHSGYGFPIGGVAAMDVEKGVISPGGIGFDINCLHPETRILTRFGYFRKIKEMEKCTDTVSYIDTENSNKLHDKPVIFLAKESDKPVLKITTKTGHEIILSSDHPLYTGSEFIEASEMREGQKIIIHPFNGIEYEEPSSDIILDENAIRSIVGNRENIVKELKEKSLLPLRYNSAKLPILAKLVGFITGDGWVGSYFSKKRSMDIWSTRIIGKQEDLEEIKEDIFELGFKATHIRTLDYSSTITTGSGSKQEIIGKSTQYHINSQALSVLLHALGVPKGNKSRTKTSVPKWIGKAPKWIKRLYLAGLFGAELNKPCQRKSELTSFTEPSFSQNKIDSLEKDNMNFILEITNLLLEFGVVANKIYRQRIAINTFGEPTHKLALRLSAKPENLSRLWGNIGYEYCAERRRLSMLALSYLNFKREYLKNLEKMIECNEIEISDMKSRVRARKYKTYKGVRISGSFPTFQEFCRTVEIPNSEFIKDEVSEIKNIEYDGYVYDFTMPSRHHNFIANCIVSHNCGMRLLTTNLTYKDVKPKLKQLVDLLFERVPAGVGSKGFVKLNKNTFREAIVGGAEWAVKQGYGWEEDLERIEENGKMEGDASKVSSKAIERGMDQIGTLGSGNHYLEIQVVKPENIVDKEIAKRMGIFPNQVVVMFHCGSRGFGHQVATDYLNVFLEVMESKYGIKILDRELACAPFQSKEGQDYFTAMKCGINMSFANRQVILHRIRECFSKVMGQSAESMEMNCVYDVAHNTAKLEEHDVNGKRQQVLVHRKGATRAFGPGREEVPKIYRDIGQPVIIGGSMETGSYLLVGTEKGMKETFGSTAHGSGRTMSRTRARQLYRGDSLQRDMEKRGIYVRTTSFAGLAEEAGSAYKDIDEVIDAVHKAGISSKVCKFVPVGNVKG
ncbi:MAG: hypothetical protein QT00_C0001G0464 [archaeon GW2011_AR5]|nr:MAG: hypothetical protein QT00_C0001G0464 [archaeon GW2011_AR5]